MQVLVEGGSAAHAAGDVTLRTVAALMACRAKKQFGDLPLGMPTGPWATADVGKAEVAEWCKNPKTGGGGWGVVWGATRARNQKRGAQRVLYCHLHRAEPSACKWRLTLEECADGWTVWAANEHSGGCAHSHTLTQSTAEANAFTAMRSIPADLLETAKTMATSGFHTKDVFRWMSDRVLERGEEVTLCTCFVTHTSCID